MKQFFIYILILTSVNISANTSINKSKTSIKPVFSIGYFGVYLLNIRRIKIDTQYRICTNDRALDGVRVSDLYSIRGDAEIADSELYLIETRREVFLGQIKTSLFSDDCIKPYQEGAYRDVEVFWQDMENFSLIIEKRIKKLQKSIEDYKKTYLSNMKSNIDKVISDITQIFIMFRSDLALEYGVYQFNQEFMKNPRLSKRVNEILSRIDLSILELYKNSLFDIYSYDNEKFVEDEFFKKAELQILKNELDGLLLGDPKRAGICNKINQIYKKYHYENERCLK